eukprot:g2415.t1
MYARAASKGGTPLFAKNTSAIRSMHHNLKVTYGGDRPVMVFTAGAPGSGKTFCLNKIFGLSNVSFMLDLDLVMPNHPKFDPKQPHLLYEQKAAYEWADERIEERFKDLLENHEKYGHKLVCFDGTGTHVGRQIRRMRMAKDAGFWIANLFVKVCLETAIRRNQLRSRKVPEDVLLDYVNKLDDAVQALYDAPHLCDEMLEYENDGDDGKSARERWGDHYDSVWQSTVVRKAIFDSPK